MCRAVPLALRLVFDALVLADGFAVLHRRLRLIALHLFALPVDQSQYRHVQNKIQKISDEDETSCSGVTALSHGDTDAEQTENGFTRGELSM